MEILADATMILADIGETSQTTQPNSATSGDDRGAAVGGSLSYLLRFAALPG